jgi:hypothetical protein
MLLVVSLLPALGAGIANPFPIPKLTVNYGINRVVPHGKVVLGEQLQATFTIVGVEAIGASLQVTRLSEIVATGKRPILSAETVTRLVY